MHHGRALLEGYVHNFNHKGRDGTAKGNIEAATGKVVHGVLYQLTGEQVLLLAPYEGGYEMIQVEIELALSSKRVSAYTYVSELCTAGLQPLPAYLEHYMGGMVENEFPQEYVEIIRKQAKQ